MILTFDHICNTCIYKKKTGNPQLTQQNPECADVLFVSHLEYEVGVSRNTLGQTTAPTKMCIHS